LALLRERLTTKCLDNQNRWECGKPTANYTYSAYIYKFSNSPPKVPLNKADFFLVVSKSLTVSLYKWHLQIIW
jgi:hypothetical protein